MSRSIRDPMIAGIAGGVISAVISGILTAYLIPFPESTVDNVVGHCMTGFICAFAGGFVGVLVHQRQSRARRA